MAPRPIIIDCHPGHDDAVALLLAFASPDELDVLGVTVVAGNVHLAHTQANARRICELAGRADVGIYAGCTAPLERQLVTAEEVHGETGLDGSGLGAPTMALADVHAVDFIIETLLAAPEGAMTLAPTGPLTNVAAAMIREPRIVPRVGEIVLMGGAAGPGNVTPAAEFNIYVDPHAADVVFASGVRLTMLGLDVTNRALATTVRLDAIRAFGNAASQPVVGMLEFYNLHHARRHGRQGGPLHDPCVVAYLLRPDLFRGRRAHVRVETADGPELGRTVVEWADGSGAASNATVIEGIDADGFYALLTERLGRL